MKLTALQQNRTIHRSSPYCRPSLASYGHCQTRPESISSHTVCPPGAGALFSVKGRISSAQRPFSHASAHASVPARTNIPEVTWSKSRPYCKLRTKLMLGRSFTADVGGGEVVDGDVERLGGVGAGVDGLDLAPDREVERHCGGQHAAAQAVSGRERDESK